MELTVILAISTITTISLAFNVYQHRKITKQKRSPSTELFQTLSDLEKTGTAILKVQRVDPSGLIQFSPRGM